MHRTEEIRAGSYAVWTNRYGREVFVRVLSVGKAQAHVMRGEKHRSNVPLEKLRPFEGGSDGFGISDTR